MVIGFFFSIENHIWILIYVKKLKIKAEKAKNKDMAADQRATDPVGTLYWDENVEGADLTTRSSAVADEEPRCGD